MFTGSALHRCYLKTGSSALPMDAQDYGIARLARQCQDNGLLKYW